MKESRGVVVVVGSLFYGWVDDQVLRCRTHSQCLEGCHREAAPFGSETRSGATLALAEG